MITPVFPTLVFSFLINDFTATKRVAAIINFSSAVPPKQTPVVTATIRYGMIIGTPTLPSAPTMAIPKGSAPEVILQADTRMQNKNTITSFSPPIKFLRLSLSFQFSLLSSILSPVAYAKAFAPAD